MYHTDTSPRTISPTGSGGDDDDDDDDGQSTAAVVGEVIGGIAGADLGFLRGGG